MALRATKSSRNALCLLVAQTFGILSPFFDLCGTCFHRAVMPVGLRRHWLIWRLPQAFRRNSRCSVDSLELEMIDAGLRWPSMQRCQSCRCIAHVSLLNWAGIAVGSIGIAGELLPKGKKTDKKS
mmetsp:Transcript_9594/g.13442  ORF Transcript_9594/g.13442 Transcript_9594/m.13442 type:complete len:125 (-) Transcript_9594:85-459(-)